MTQFATPRPLIKGDVVKLKEHHTFKDTTFKADQEGAVFWVSHDGWCVVVSGINSHHTCLISDLILMRPNSAL